MAAPLGNKYGCGGNGGRPPVFENKHDLQQEIDAYFEYIKGDFIEKQKVKNGELLLNEFGEPDMGRIYSREAEPVTVTGLALYLGFASRQSMYDYEERNEAFSYLILRARMRVENSYERRLDHRDKVHGSTFALSNMGWTANNKRELTGPGGKALFDGKTDAELAAELKTIAGKLDE